MIIVHHYILLIVQWMFQLVKMNHQLFYSLRWNKLVWSLITTSISIFISLYHHYVAFSGIDEKALRESIFGKVLFGVLDVLFPVFKEPNWFDIYDRPLTAEENLELPYFDGYDFVNSSWTFHIRHRYGIWNWLDRFGLVPMTTNRVFLREDGKTVWSDGYYGDWWTN